jgi:hypothetical protein
MYSANNTESPVHIFEGFTSLVAEYVWRVRGGSSETSGKLFLGPYKHSTNSLLEDDREFQLITFDRDSNLRFWPIDMNLMQVSTSTYPAWRPILMGFRL